MVLLVQGPMALDWLKWGPGSGDIGGGPGEAGQAFKVCQCTKGPDKAFLRAWEMFFSGGDQELTGEGPDQPHVFENGPILSRQ